MNYQNKLKSAASQRSNPVTRLSAFLLTLLLSVSAFVHGQIVQTFNSSGSFTVPAGVTSLTVYIYGAGGGGGGGTTGADFANGGGGGGGASSVNAITVSPAQVYTVTVGAGGTAGTPTANGGTGGTSTFAGAAGTFTAAGGLGGTFSTGLTGTFAGGAGGSTGTGTVFSGDNGSAGDDTAPGITGSGGGGAGSAANGSAGPASCTGVAAPGGTGTYPGGNGGYNTGCGTASNVTGAAGLQPGGGGSGDNSFSSNLNGGAGGAGRIIVVYTPACTTPAAPTTLALIPGYTSVTGTFTAPATPPTNYLVIRTTTAAAPSTPVQGTTYTAGTTALGGTIVSTNTTTGFTDNGLAYGTQYWYWIYAYNSGCASTNPVYSSTSLNGNTTTTACTTQTNTLAITAAGNYTWSTAAWSRGHAPLPCEDAIITGSGTINGTATINLAANTTVNSLSITLTGAGANGATALDKLFFNTNAFALTITNDLNLTNTSAGNGGHQLECNISASGSLTCNNFNTNVNGTGGNNTHILDVNSYGTFQVNGVTLAKATETSGSGGQVLIGVGDLPATAIFNGTALFDDGTTSSVSSVYLGTTAATGNTTGTMVFKANATFGAKAFSVLGNTNGSDIFDASSAQTLTVNNATTMYFPSVLIGNANSPVVTMAGTGNPILNATAATPTLSVNNNSVLDLGTYTFNVSSAVTSTISLAAGATLKVGGTTGGTTGSNFPLNYSTYTFAPTSTVEYNGAAQTIFATPAYGALTLSATGTKTAGAALTVNGNFTINSPATFAALTYTHNMGGNWVDAGTFTPATSKIRFNGSGAQSITKTGGETFAGLIVNKATGLLSLNNNITVTAVLNLTNGILATGANTLTLGVNGSTNNASSANYVNGTMLKAVANSTLNPTFTFPIGDATSYTPVTLTGTGTTTAAGLFGGTTTAGDLTTPTGSGFDYTKSVNRNWTLGSNLAGISAYAATFNYPSSEVDAGTTPANFVTKYTNGTVWTGTTVSGTPTNTSTSVTGIASLSTAGYTFQIAQLLTFAITSSAGNHGSISPNGTTNVSYGGSQTYTITPNACYSINKVLVDGVNNAGAVSSGTYTFSNVTATHTISTTYSQNGPYTITVTAGANGSITPGTSNAIVCGSNATYTITPAACYSITDVLVDGASVGALGTYTFSNVTANHTISASFSLNTYTITATSGPNGTVTPAGASTVNCGSNKTYTISPAACYSIANVLVDGVSAGAVTTYTFNNITANHTISATFAINTYTATVNAGANGTIMPGSATVNCGSNNTYTITANACYHIVDVTLNGVSQGAVGTLNVNNVQANYTVAATFAINTYTATVNAGANGTITPGSATVNCGSNNTYTITANACYHIVDVTLNGVSQGAVGNLNVNNVQANYTVAATFAINTYTATVNAGANGTITPGSGTVNCGSNNTYTITANACYHIVDVTLNGVSQGAVGTLNVNNVQANYTVAATFAINTYTATVNAGANGTITPGSATVNCGSNNTYTITANACYHIVDVTLNGVSQGAVGTLNVNNVQANYTVAATFAINTYTITATSGANGTVTPAGATTVNCGANQTYTITPDACYSIADVLVDGVSVGAVGTYTFTNVTASHTISASFSLNTFTITATSGANGTVTPAGATTVNCGANQTYTITPDACYSIADVLVDGVSVGAVGTYTFTNVTASHTISATFSLNTFTITATSGANGTVTPAGATTVNCGANQTYTITPAACYSIADVLVDGVSVGAVGTYTFTNVTTNHTISATFSLNTFTITATSGANGTVTPAGATTVNCGANQTYTITPNACYSIADVLVDGVSVGAVGTYTFTNVTASHTISATFSLNTYTITATSGANGTVTPAGATTVNCGVNQTYTITPDACYSIADVLVDGVSVGAVGTYTFTNVTASHTISATFSLNTFTITATSGANGTVTPAGATTVNCGANQTYTITPDACYSIADVLVDGVSVGAVGTYTFTNVTASHTISATFSLNTFTITATSGANGTVTPAGATTVNCGANQTYTITPAACYSIADVLVDGVSVGAVGTYTFTNVTASHTISATFSLNTYTITATSGANGTVTPAGATTVNCGANQTYTITPDACYSIADVLVDGVSVGAVGTYTFTNVTASHTISATFSLNTYTITATSGANGTVTPAGATTVNCGANQTYTITPDACYSIADVLVDGVSVGAVGTYTFNNVTASHTISATFPLNTFTITATSGANGTVTPAGATTVNCGANQTYTITPAACYSIADVLVDGVSVGAVGTYTFTNVTASHTISATFSLNTFTITATSGANGTVTPAGATTVNCGANQTYTITPDACYSIADVLVDGVSVGAVGTYTFTNVTASHTISATFSLNTFTITATSGANGTVTPAGATTVNCGANQTYTITPDACYSIADVLVDGVSVGAVGTYTFTNVTASHTISATFSLNTYTITATSGANGTVTPAGATTVNCGANQTYTITPDACYSIADVLVDGVSAGAVGTYTFTNVTASHTISATFSINTFTITATSGANGTVTPAGATTVNCGANQTYTITPDACYSIADVLVDGVSVAAVGTYTFTNVTASHTISATFSLNTSTITATSGANGTVTPAGATTVNCGANQTYTITPAACYSIADVLVDGVSVGAAGTYTFNNVTASHTISATFSLNTYAITATSGANGTVTPAGATTVNCGANQTYTITPAACYSIANVLVDGVSVGAVGTYTFTNVTTNHTISATFSLNTFTITATSGANGTVTPAGTTTVNCGANQAYTITPAACYNIADVLVDGVSVGAVGTYTFTNVTAGHTISASFVAATYTINASAGAGGTITPSGAATVACGGNATYTIAANNCYSITNVVVDGISQGAVSTYTFTNVTANHTISATFTQNTYIITVSAGTGGTVTPGTGAVNCGSNATYTITAAACNHIVDVLVDGVSQGAVSTYTFTNVTAAHTISATFTGNAAPATPTVTGPVNVCTYIGTGAQVTYTATSAGATGFTWVIPPTNVAIVTGQGTANLTVTFQNGFAAQGNKQLRVTATSACGNSSQTLYVLVAQTPGTPGPITGNTNVCPIIGTAATYTYTINSVLAASSYIWTVPSGATIVSHPAGTGANDTVITVSFSGSFVNNTSITVASANNCNPGGSAVRSLAISRPAPATPGLISGPGDACPYMAPNGTPATYSIAAVAGAVSYTWTVPGGVTITGQGTTSISFTYASNFTSGSVTVTATNGCGTSAARSLGVSKYQPAAPSNIDVILVSDCPNRVYSYTISSMPANAVSIQWIVPAGATIVSGQGTTSITVSYPATSVNGNITAQAINNCSASSIRSTAIRLPTCAAGPRPFAKLSATQTPATAMQVSIYPNPSVNDYRLKILTAGTEKITVKISDMRGREFKNFIVLPYQTINVGADLKAGAYILEVRQGDETQTSKLIKF